MFSQCSITTLKDQEGFEGDYSCRVFWCHVSSNYVVLSDLMSDKSKVVEKRDRKRRRPQGRSYNVV